MRGALLLQIQPLSILLGSSSPTTPTGRVQVRELWSLAADVGAPCSDSAKCLCLHLHEGVSVKYVVDSTLDAVPSGQTAQQAAFEGNMHFSQYLAAKTLSVDVWDGESLLQV